MKTSSLDAAIEDVESVARRSGAARMSVASVTLAEDPEWKEAALEFMAVATSLTKRWGAFATQGAHPDWFPAASASASWGGFPVRVFLALHLDGDELVITLGCG